MIMTETLSAAIPDDVETAVHALLRQADQRGVTLAAAESCTGGLLASLLTDVDGAGHVFERGFVTYSPESKCELLGLARADIDRCGVVSEPVARAMAEGALRASHADLALAITGFAGPAGPDDEAGLVHFACARRDGDTTHRMRRFGDIGRGPTRVACLRESLSMLDEAVRQGS